MISTTAEATPFLDRLLSFFTSPASTKPVDDPPRASHGGDGEEGKDLDLTIEQEAVYLALLHGAVPF